MYRELRCHGGDRLSDPGRQRRGGDRRSHDHRNVPGGLLTVGHVQRPATLPAQIVVANVLHHAHDLRRHRVAVQREAHPTAHRPPFGSEPLGQGAVHDHHTPLFV